MNTRTRLLTRSVMAAGALLAALGLITPAQAQAPAPACHYGTELTRTVAELGDTVDSFHVTGFTNGYYGFVRFSEGYARLHPGMPCTSVADTVRHEWMHLQQVRHHGDRDAVYAHYGERKHFERVAACGQILLGSDDASYLDPEHPLYSGPCTDADIDEAWTLIHHAE